jgi:hypothetical protein
MFTQLSSLLEAKKTQKTHDECSDEIDGYHGACREALTLLERELKGKDGHDLAAQALKQLNKAIALAKQWDRRCG